VFGGLDVDLAARGLLELGDPVESLVGLAALDIARPISALPISDE
jgi:hypothetical protein